MLIPKQDEFLKLVKQGNLIPVFKEITGDLETPVTAYLKIASKSKYSFLLESVEGEEKVARFSFAARDPELILESKNNQVTITKFNNGTSVRKSYSIKDTPLTFIRDIFKKYTFVNRAELPRFCGGMVGFASYDVVRFFENLPDKTTDDLKLPDTLMVLAKNLIIFDHLSHKIKILHCAEVNQQSSQAAHLKSYKKAIKEIELLASDLQQPLKIPVKKNKKSKKAQSIKSNFTKSKFENIVKEAKKQIRAGEIIQIVLSQRFEIGIQTNPFNIYRSLRALNPSPYMYYLNFDKIQIVGSSPELLVRCENGVVETRPIAGTRPRGKNNQQDIKLAKELLADPKEKAEHIMLVDLGRNDLGRVCKKGTVKISEFMNIEKYSHVMHIVSNVVGELSPEMDDFDVLQASFPAGTVSGAPKIRAMEIIEDLETVRRGPYAGCIGYFSFSGNLDTCITIRTIVVKDKKAYIQAGAGIVADSKPATEYQETLNKAKAQIKAIEIAHKI